MKNIHKTVLIVNSFASNRYLSETLKKNDIYTIGLYTLDLNKLINEYHKPADDLFDQLTYLPNATIHEVIKYFDGINIDYIINGSDSFESTNLTEQLTLHLTPLYANNPKTSALRSDKIEMHRLLEKNNLAFIKQILIKKDSYLKQPNNIKYPAFIKPINGSGSVGAIAVESLEDVTKYLEKDIKLETGSIVRDYILAEKIEGDEYLIDTFSLNGEHFIATIQKYNKEIINGFPQCFGCKVEEDSYRIEKISQYVKDVLNSTEFNNGFAHVECFYTESNDVVLIEVNPRISGAAGMCHKLSKYSGGYSQIDIMLNKVFNIELTRTNNTFAEAILLYNGGVNIVPNLNNMNLNKYGVVEIYQFIHAGQMSNQSVGKVGDAMAIIIVVGSSRTELTTNITRIRQLDNSSWRTI